MPAPLARQLHIALGLVLALLLGPAQAAELTIGQVAPFSGPLKPTGTHLSAGIQLYLDAVNAAGGVNGASLRLVTRDDGYRTEETLKQVRELIAKEAPIALIGLVGTANVDAVLKQGLLDEARTPLIGVRSGAAGLREPTPAWLFHTRASYAREVRAIVRQMQSMSISPIAVFHQADSFGEDGLQAARAALAEVSIPLAAVGSYPRNTTEVAAAVASIGAARPAGVIMVSNTAASAAFIKQFRAAGHAAQLIALSVTDGPQVAERIGTALARGLGVVQIVPDPLGGTAPLAREIRNAWAKQPIAEVSLNHTVMEGYLMAKVLVEVLQRAGPNPGQKELLRALNGLHDFDAGGVAISFTPENHDGARFTDITVLDQHGRAIR